MTKKAFTLKKEMNCHLKLVLESQIKTISHSVCHSELVSGSNKKQFKRAFTLAEVLITLAIIGVVAAISIPSVISNTQQQEFKTGLRKAVSVLNSAITMNMAIDGETPYDNQDLFNYLQRHMNIISTFSKLYDKYQIIANNLGRNNAVFYTADGMRFEFYSSTALNHKYPLYEKPRTFVCVGAHAPTIKPPSSRPEDIIYYSTCGGCGSLGLNNNIDGTTKPPCLITVDVNGDRKPSPVNAFCKNSICAQNNVYKNSDPLGLKLSDIFSIMITDREAIPYGIAAQRAMYQAQAKK